MVERELDGDGCEFGTRRVEERSAGRGQPNALDFFHPSAAKALMDGVVPAFDRKKGLALAASLCGNQFSGGDHALFVRQSQALSCANRFVGGFKSRNADDGANYEVNAGMSGYVH